jgi:hypothetical protein
VILLSRALAHPPRGKTSEDPPRLAVPVAIVCLIVGHDKQSLWETRATGKPREKTPSRDDLNRPLTRMFHELMSRDREDGCATRSAGACVACRATVPRYRGIGSEAYLNGTSQGPTPEDARKDGHIRGRSKRFMKSPG